MIIKSKRILAGFLAIVMMISLAACGNKASEKKETGKEETKKSENTTYKGSAEGYGGDVTAEVTIKDGKIQDIKATGDKETPTIGGTALEDLSKKWLKLVQVKSM